MQHLNIQCMKKHTLGFTWNTKVVTAIKLKMKFKKRKKKKTNKNNYSELNQLLSKKKKKNLRNMYLKQEMFFFIL